MSFVENLFTPKEIDKMDEASDIMDCIADTLSQMGYEVSRNEILNRVKDMLDGCVYWADVGERYIYFDIADYILYCTQKKMEDVLWKHGLNAETDYKIHNSLSETPEGSWRDEEMPRYIEFYVGGEDIVPLTDTGRMGVIEDYIHNLEELKEKNNEMEER